MYFSTNKKYSFKQLNFMENLNIQHNKLPIIRKETFNNSLYYIAPGFDFEPLYRFSNICNHFFYANLYYTKQQVINHMNSDLKNSEFLEVVSINEHDDFDELTYFEMHQNYRQHLTNAFTSFSEIEKKNYIDSFVPAKKEKQWLLEIDIKRKGLNRIIKLYYFTGEGLASYIALSHNGLFPPKILCTIQTSILENANGLMSRFLKQTEKLPFLWVRGFEAQYYKFTQEFNSALNKDELYPNIGMSFNFQWKVNASYTGHFNTDTILTNRYCKAYITDKTMELINNTPFKQYHKNKILQGEIQNLIPKTFDEKTLILIPSSLNKFMPETNKNLTISFWDEITDFTKIISLSESLNFIEKVAEKRDYDSIYFTVNGIEDEGILLDQFLDKKHRAKMFPVIKDLVDLYDLRYFNSNKMI